MPLVICTLKAASTKINGVEFKQTDKGLISENVSQEVADHFASIDGFEVIKAQGKAGKPSQPDQAELPEQDKAEPEASV
jgi:hypothetical protein